MFTYVFATILLLVGNVTVLAKRFKPLLVKLIQRQIGMAATRQYQYQPLADNVSFRLLRLERVPANLRLRCFMMEVSITDLTNFEYVAMSYTWGPPSDKVPIQCGDSNQTIMIPGNLYSALHCLAREPWQGVMDTDEPIGYDIWIWSDAICIDQSNQDERSQQVQLMRQIYQSASIVMVWLGEQKEANRNLIQLVSNLHETLSTVTAGQDPKSIDTVALKDAGQIPAPASEDWIKLGDLYREPYFSRKWVIQEVASARKIGIMKGPLVIPSVAVWQLPALLINTDLVSVVKMAQLENLQLQNAQLQIAPHDWKLNGLIQASFMSVQRTKLWSQAPMTLLELLWRFRDSQATDPKDHIFALVGISSDGNHPAYRVDYKREVTELYRSFAWTTIAQYSTLQILSLAGLQDGIVDLASWIPDWTVAPQVWAYGMAFPGAFQASGMTDGLITHDLDDAAQSPPYQNAFATLKSLLLHPSLPLDIPTPGYACLSNNGTILTVLGKVIDTVKTLGTAQTADEIIPVLNKTSTIPDWVRSKWTPQQLQARWSMMLFGESTRAEAETLTIALHSYPDYIAGGTMDDALWRTLICNTTFTGERIPDAFHDNYLSWRAVKSMLQSEENIFDATMSEHYAKAKVFDQVHGNAISGKRLFTTRRGFIGLAPSRTAPEDIVCILKGSTVPFILRQAGERYVLVGECYCHGIMYGEAMQKSDIRMREFSIV